MAAAQVAAQAAAAPAPAREPAAPLAAAALERVTLLDLRLADDPAPDDFRAAAIAFQLAERLDPADPRLVRRTISAAWAAGDSTRLLDATRRLVRLDPKDTVAQLRLLTDAVEARQTAEERLEFYQRTLGPRGAAIDPSVRSRLALDAALLLREQGDTGAFAAMLAQSLRLDPTNKDAASLAAQFHSARSDDPAGQLELLVNLLYADPVDPQVHQAIARLLAAEGAVVAARRFITNASTVDERLGQERIDSYIRKLVADWAVDGPEAVLRPLNAELSRAREDAQNRIEMLTAAGADLDGVTPPEEILLPAELDRLRLLAAVSADDATSIRSCLTDIEQGLKMATLTLAQQAGGISVTDEQFLPVLIRFIDLQLARGISGQDTENMAEEIETFAERYPPFAASITNARAWSALRTQGPEAALAMAETAPADDQVSQLAAAAALQELERTDEAAELLRSIVAVSPLLPIGQAARDRLNAMLGAGSTRSRSADALEAFVSRIPAWIDRAVSQPSTMMLLRVRETEPLVPPSRSAFVRIELTNISPVPLGLGSDRTISSRLLLQPALDPTPVGAAPLPEVLELDQRLRLMPQETLAVTVPADAPFTELLVQTSANTTLRQRWRVLQDFRVGARGAIVEGPLSLASGSGSVRRPPLPEASLPPEQVAARLQAASDGELPTILTAAATACLAAPEVGQRAIATAAIERYNAATDASRVLMLCLLPHAGIAPGMSEFDAHARAVLAAAPAELDARVVAATVLTRVTDPEDEALSRLIDTGREPVAELAALHRGRLMAGAACYARASGALSALAGRGLAAAREQASSEAAP